MKAKFIEIPIRSVCCRKESDPLIFGNGLESVAGQPIPVPFGISVGPKFNYIKERCQVVVDLFDVNFMNNERTPSCDCISGVCPFGNVTCLT